jgi:hypothetical protein
VTEPLLKQFSLLPECADQFGATAHSFKSPQGMVAQFGKRFRTKIGQLMVLPIPPDVFHWVKLRSIGRQVLKTEGAVLLGHKVFDQPAMVGSGAIPDHQQLSFDVAHQMREKLNDLGASNTARMKLKVEVPPSDASYGRKLLPIKRILQHRSLSFR